MRHSLRRSRWLAAHSHSLRMLSEFVWLLRSMRAKAPNLDLRGGASVFAYNWTGWIV